MARRATLVRQSEAAECGLACVATVLAHHGGSGDLAAMRRRHAVTVRGTTLSTLLRIADDVGFEARALKVPLGRLGDVTLPAILHWDMNHWVVALAVRRGRVLVADPASDVRWHDRESLSRHYTGVAMEMLPTDRIERSGPARRLRLRDLWRGASGARRAAAQVVVLSAILQVHVLASPYLLQIAVDRAIPSDDGALVATLGLGFAALAAIGATATALRSLVLLSSGAALSHGMAASLGRRLLRLPVEWFERRSVGDVLSRFQSVAPLQRLMTEGAPAAVVDGALALLTLALMCLYSLPLAAIPVAGVAAYAAIRACALGAERRAQSDRIAAMGREQEAMLENVSSIASIRAAGSEAHRHAVWSGRLADQSAAVRRHERIRVLQAAAGGFVASIDTILVICVAASFAMRGGFSVGMVFAFLSYRLQFSTAGRALVDRLSETGVARLHLDRLADIAAAEEDPSHVEPPRRPRMPRGGVSLERVRYAHGPFEPEILRGVDLVVAPGEHVAITGPSGGGKSTLVRILLGLIEPTSGLVAIDGTPLAEFGRRAWLSGVGAVLQDDRLFSGTIERNVAAAAEHDDALLEEAMRSAGIWEDVQAMPMRGRTLVGDMGSALSGGQRQRVLLARALYRRPRVLVMDESTSSLDAELERRVADAVSRLDATRIVVAHRRETIAAADRVLELRDGLLTEVPRSRP